MKKDQSRLHLALPDGHLMAHVLPFMDGAGLRFEGYDKKNLDRRPRLQPESEQARDLIREPDRVAVKVIRPQDMPMHVANANFDAAVSGTDWLMEHKLRFPTSPVAAQRRLGFGQVRIVAAVHQDHGETLADYIASFRSGRRDRYIKIASEYVYIADDYAQRNNLFPYRIIMTYGATESLIPEDCDMIIENTETGNTLKKNSLRIIDTLEVLGSHKSEGCLVVSQKSMQVGWKREMIEAIDTLFGLAAGGPVGHEP
jgi:ATP phosphoribosyltransferase